jgi:hypothetical protein
LNFPAAAADRRKKFLNFEPPPPIRNKCSRAAADKRKKILKFRAAAADQVIGLHLYSPIM